VVAWGPVFGAVLRLRFVGVCRRGRGDGVVGIELGVEVERERVMRGCVIILVDVVCVVTFRRFGLAVGSSA
jgi:hypothetical protein